MSAKMFPVAYCISTQPKMSNLMWIYMYIISCAADTYALLNVLKNPYQLKYDFSPDYLIPAFIFLFWRCQTL